MKDLSQIKKKGIARNGFVLYALGLIEQLENDGRFGLAGAYRSSVKSLVKFMNNERIPFQAIQHAMLLDYEKWFISDGGSQNSAHFYLRNLRAIFNKAVSEKVIRPRTNPFEGMSLDVMPTCKRALPKRWLKRIKNLDLKEGSSLEMSRDMFLFSFYACGMGFADMVALTHDKIQNGVIHYERIKTGRPVSVFVDEAIQALIDKYRTGSSYVWPILDDNADKKQNYNLYRNALNNFNRNLKIIAQKADIPESLSSYMARHSWATAARNELMPTAVISSCLGHASEKTTQIYLDSFNENLIKRINRKVTNLI